MKQRPQLKLVKSRFYRQGRKAYSPRFMSLAMNVHVFADKSCKLCTRSLMKSFLQKSLRKNQCQCTAQTTVYKHEPLQVNIMSCLMGKSCFVSIPLLD